MIFMPNFLHELFQRNQALAIFGACHFVLFAALGLLLLIDNRLLLGVNVWIKPMKFAVSIAIYSWTMAWLLAYLPDNFPTNGVVWTIILTMFIEMVCIGAQAARGVPSHFNVQSAFDGAIFTTMGIAITINTVAVGVVAFGFFRDSLNMETPYLWAIRLSLLIFIVASLEGFVMASRLQHGIGAPDGTVGLPFLNWSRSVGDLRVAHFIGLHAIQILPLTAWLLSARLQQQTTMLVVIVLAVVYSLVCILAFLQALAAKPFIRL